MSTFNLELARLNAEALVHGFDEAFERIQAQPGWWPDALSPSTWVIVRAREVGPAVALESLEFRRWLLRALHEWVALRGNGAVSLSRLTRYTNRLRPALEGATGLTLSELESGRDGDQLLSLFSAVDGLKPGGAQMVASSKLLYHLLPDLIVPFDATTARFFGGLPNHSDSWLVDAYSVLSDIARGVGSHRLEELSRSVVAVDPSTVGALRLGQGRVVDFGIQGFVRSRSQDDKWRRP